MYQPEAEYEVLHESQRYRHVRYEPPDTDYTWERSGGCGWTNCRSIPPP